VEAGVRFRKIHARDERFDHLAFARPALDLALTRRHIKAREPTHLQQVRRLAWRGSSMRPLTVVNAIVLGSAAAITFGLTAVLIIYLILKDRHPQLAQELGPLLRSASQFAVLTIVSGVSFLAMLKNLRWRWIAHSAMWLSVITVGVLYWPG